MRNFLFLLCLLQVTSFLSIHAGSDLSDQTNVSKTRIDMKGGFFKGGTQRCGVRQIPFDAFVSSSQFLEIIFFTVPNDVYIQIIGEAGSCYENGISSADLKNEMYLVPIPNLPKGIYLLEISIDDKDFYGEFVIE